MKKKISQKPISLTTIARQLHDLTLIFERGFARMERKFDAVDKKLGRVNMKIDSLNKETQRL